MVLIPELFTGPENTKGNLAAVCDKYLVQHGRIDPCCRERLSDDDYRLIEFHRLSVFH